MSPLTHWQLGSLLAHVRPYNLRERRFIMLAAVAPDVDGAFIFFLSPDENGVCLGQGPWFEALHHTFGHSLFFGLLISLAFALYNRARRLELFFICLLSFTLHLASDFLTNGPSWPHHPFWPLPWTLFVDHYFHVPDLERIQMVYLQYFFMILIFAGVVIIYLKKGRTFLELISPRLDLFLTNFITLPWRQRCVVCGARAFYRESESGEPLCPSHVRFLFGIEGKKPSGQDPS
jgi:membrane-bound metal-dependent hydrolase YbcI (DUF457 family)